MFHPTIFLHKCLCVFSSTNYANDWKNYRLLYVTRGGGGMGGGREDINRTAEGSKDPGYSSDVQYIYRQNNISMPNIHRSSVVDPDLHHFETWICSK